jgi:choline monooxygenase
VLEAHPTFAAQHCRARHGDGRGQLHLLYPNTCINVFPGPANVSIGPLLPRGPHRTERFLDYFFPPGADAAWLAEFFALDDQVGREDAALVESVQRGMGSGLLEHGRLMVGSEPLLAAFEAWVRERLEDDDERRPVDRE